MKTTNSLAGRNAPTASALQVRGRHRRCLTDGGMCQALYAHQEKHRDGCMRGCRRRKQNAISIFLYLELSIHAPYIFAYPIPYVQRKTYSQPRAVLETPARTSKTLRLHQAPQLVDKYSQKTVFRICAGMFLKQREIGFTGVGWPWTNQPQ